MLHAIGLVVLLMFSRVLGENCLSYNFESDYENLFHKDNLLCDEAEPWQLGNYTSVDVAGAPYGSGHFIEPAFLSCGSSFSFHMGGGILEVNVYMNAKSERDQVTVLVNELLESGKGSKQRATATIQPTLSSYTDGWNVIRINLPDTFTGYLTFLGVKYGDSIVLIDSFRFYSLENEKECKVYDGQIIPTSAELGGVESTTELSKNPDDDQETTIIDLSETSTSNVPEYETTSSAPEVDTTEPDFELEITATPETIDTTTTKSPEAVEQCVTYNFDHDFDSLFTDEHDLCGNFTTWSLSDYTNTEIDAGNAKGNLYLRPSDELSCISAFPIRMSPNGIVEVNVYVDPVTELDHVIVLVKKVVVGSTDTVAGFYIYEPSVSTFVRGWNVLRVSVATLTSFDGYLLFLGIASEGSTVLVDSFRYIPPWTSAEDESCAY